MSGMPEVAEGMQGVQLLIARGATSHRKGILFNKGHKLKSKATCLNAI